MVSPLFPALTISYIESHWFAGDEPIDEDAVLSLMEKEQGKQYNELPQKFEDYLPQSASNSNDQYEDDEEEEEEEDNDDDDEGSASNGKKLKNVLLGTKIISFLADDDNTDELDIDNVNYNDDSPILNRS